MTNRPSEFESGIKCVPIEESTVGLPQNSVKSSDEILTELFGSFNAKPPDSLDSFDSHSNKSNKHHKKNRKRSRLRKHKRKPKSKKSIQRHRRKSRMSFVGPQTCKDKPSDIADNYVSRPASVNSEETCFGKKSRPASVGDKFVNIDLPILNQNVSSENSCSDIELIQQETGLVSLDLQLNRPSSISLTPSRPNHHQNNHSINASADATVVHITDQNSHRPRPTDAGRQTNETLVTGRPMDESSSNTMLVEDKKDTLSITNVEEDRPKEFNLLQTVTEIVNTEVILSPIISYEEHVGLDTRKKQNPSVTEVIHEMVKQEKSKSASRERSRSPVKKRKKSKECSPEQDVHKCSSKKSKHRNRSKSQEIDHHHSKNGKGNKTKNDNHANRKKRSKSRDFNHESKDRKRRSRSVEKSAHSSDRKKNRSVSRDRKARAGDKKRRSKSCDERSRHEVNHNKSRVKGKRSRSRDRDRRKRSISREKSSDRKNTRKRKGRSVSKDKRTQRKSRDRSRSRDLKQRASVDRGRSAEKKIEKVSRERSTSRSEIPAEESHLQNPAEEIRVMEPENPSSVKEVQGSSNDVEVLGSNQSISPSIDKVEENSESENPVSLQIDNKDILNKDLDSDQTKFKEQSNNHDEDKCKTGKKKSHKNNRKSRSKSPIKDSHQRDKKRRSKSADSCSHHSRPKKKSRSRSRNKDYKKSDKRRRSKSKDGDGRRSDRKSRSKSRSRQKINRVKKGKSKDREDHSKNKTRSKSKDTEGRNANRKSRSISQGKDKSSHRTDKRSRSKSRDKDKSSHRTDKRSRSKSRDKDKSNHRPDRRSRSKSRDKDKSSHRTDKRSLSKSQDKDKSSHRTDKRSRSKSRDKDKSSHRTDKRSRSKSRDKDKSSHRTDKRSRSKSRDKDKSSHRTDKRSRSKSRDKDKSSHRTEKRSRSKSPDRSRRNVRKRRSRSREVHIDKRKLFEIARKNAMSMLKQAAAPFATTENIVTIKAGGKSVEELTDFCKQLSKREAGASSGDSDDDEARHSDGDIERPFHHPFQLKERPTNIVLNIRNSVAVPTKTFQEKTAEQSKQLRLQFPVSSGQNHRKTESEWVPVAPGQPSTSVQPSSSTGQSSSQTPVQPVSTAVPSTVLDAGQTDSQSGSSVFPPAPASPPDIGNIVEKRMNAMRKLTANPNDSQAMSQIYQVNQQMSMWLASKQQPGQFTGSTGAKVLTAAQLGTGYQAWAKKDQLMTAAPVSGGMGMALLQKMGWRPGEGLGKNKEGSLEPLSLEVKMDKKGLVAQEELGKKHQSSGRVNHKTTNTLAGKHPVSLLVEFCSKRHWDSPQFHVCFECGPDHKKNFLFKVRVNGTEYQPSVASNNKKQAKAEAARLCLQTLGLLYPDTPK